MGKILSLMQRAEDLFSPNDYPWCDMEVDLSRVIRKDIEAGQGGSELEMDEVYSLIAYSMS